MSRMLVSAGRGTGFPDGDTELTFSAGGDEGYSFALSSAKGFFAEHAGSRALALGGVRSRGPGADVTDVYETELQLVSGSFAVVDARVFAQPTSESASLPFRLARQLRLWWYSSHPSRSEASTGKAEDQFV